MSHDIIFLGQVPRKEGLGGDDILDDTALAITSTHGVVVVTGCSHSGIANICEYAKEISGLQLHAVIGGFHLFEHDKRGIDIAIDYFKKEKIQHLYPMHCVDFPTISRFHTQFGIKKFSSGDVIEL